MSEEDIIDIAEKIANFGWSDYDDFVINKKAIQGLLDLYNKEKEKNKSIESQRLRDMCYKTDGNYISKDKIIKLLNKYDKASFIAKVDLQELLVD